MDTEKLGLFLEQQGFSDEGIDEYLEHFGKMGMHWGQRSGKQKTAVVAAGWIAGSAVNTVLRATGHKKIGFIAGTAATFAGAVAMGRLMDIHGKKKASDVKNARRVLFGDK